MCFGCGTGGRHQTGQRQLTFCVLILVKKKDVSCALFFQKMTSQSLYLGMFSQMLDNSPQHNFSLQQGEMPPQRHFDS
jgi:hypothetical protein